MTVADYIAEYLVSKDVKHVFGFQGSAMLKMLDAIVATGKIEYVQNLHEQASAFAADAYARIQGKTGVAMATSGPGASNLITGIANAYFDSIPVLFITGQDRRAHICSGNGCRQNGFQDMDIVSMSRKVVKRAVQVLDACSLAEELDRCWALSEQGRKGPVLIDVPIDLQFEEMPEHVICHKDVQTKKKQRVDDRLVEAAVKVLREARRPAILVGGGVRLAGACDRLDAFSRKVHIPVVSTLMGLDATKETLGFTGLYGNSLPNLILKEADCILALGTRFAFHQTGKDLAAYSSAKVVHVDVDETELGRVYHDAICIKADISSFLDAIIDCEFPHGYSSWSDKVERWRERFAQTPAPYSARFLKRLFATMPGDAIVTADVGSNQMQVAQEFAPSGINRLLNSGGLGAMGYSLPAAIGASYASASPVVAICGDGGFQMNLQELNTLALRKRNVKVFVFDNSVLGLMRGIQRDYYGSRFHGNTPREFACPDVCRLAGAFGIDTARISSTEDFSRLDDVFADDRPWLVDVVIDADDMALSRKERTDA